MTAVVFFPANFRSWGTPPMTAPGKMRQCEPMREPLRMVTLGPIQVPGPISTSAAMVEKGLIVTPSPICASGWMTDMSEMPSVGVDMLMWIREWGRGPG